MNTRYIPALIAAALCLAANPLTAADALDKLQGK